MDFEIFLQRSLSYTGLIIVGFVSIHLAGLIYAGINPNGFEIYASNLHSNTFLPYIELSLTFIFFIHIILTINKVVKNISSTNKASLVSRRNDFLGVLAYKIQPLSGLILASFLFIHLLQLRFPRPEVSLELDSLKNNLESNQNLALYCLASIALFFHMIQGIESGHRSLGILNTKNSLKIRYVGRFLSIFSGLSFLIVTFYLRFI